VRLVLATNNDHKRRELSAILSGHELLLPADLGLRFSHEETGATFGDNALGKAVALYGQMAGTTASPGGAPLGVIADDSGLSVAALDGRPGVFSARYGSEPGGRELADADRNSLLLSELDGIDDRRAHYTCCMALVLEPDRYYLCQETWHGEIAHAPSDGRHGFGYDPIFFLRAEGLTVAEIPPERKNRISHRGKAARDLATIINALEREGRLDGANGSA
jgi:XTP/dITP diphosphohydrolase